MKNIVIVVDMQNGFSRYPQTQELSQNIAQLLDRKLFDVVIATRFLNDKASIYEKLFGWKKLESEEEQKIPDDILKNVDYVVEKYIYNCINANFIQRLCQLNDGTYPEKVFVIGADTDCCVLTIATALFENNIRPVVLTKYCDSNGGESSHKAGILSMERLIGEKQLVDIEPTLKDELNNI